MSVSSRSKHSFSHELTMSISVAKVVSRDTMQSYINIAPHTSWDQFNTSKSTLNWAHVALSLLFYPWTTPGKRVILKLHLRASPSLTCYLWAGLLGLDERSHQYLWWNASLASCKQGFPRREEGMRWRAVGRDIVSHNRASNQAVVSQRGGISGELIHLRGDLRGIVVSIPHVVCVFRTLKNMNYRKQQ